MFTEIRLGMKKRKRKDGGEDREVLEVEWVLGSDMLGEEGHILLKQTLQTHPLSTTLR